MRNVSRDTNEKDLRNRFGFTLVELLVVIAIIGILVGMLLPAVHAVRNRALQIKCTNNLRQLSMACFNYQSDHLKFPSGAGPLRLEDTSLSTVGGSWLGSILPFIEQGNLANRLTSADSGVPTNEQLIQDCSNFASNFEVQFFFCPAATQQDYTSNDPLRRGRTSHYVGSAGPSINSNSTVYDIHDPGVSGSGPIGLNGLFSPSSRVPGSIPPVYSNRLANTIADVSDGLSNTLAIGESSRSASPDGRFVPHRVGWTFGANGIFDMTVNGFVPVDIYSVKSFGTSPINSMQDYVVNPELRNSQCFSSNHSGGVIFSKADTSTSFVSQLTDLNVLIELSSINGNELTSADDLN